MERRGAFVNERNKKETISSSNDCTEIFFNVYGLWPLPEPRDVFVVLGFYIITIYTYVCVYVCVRVSITECRERSPKEKGNIGTYKYFI